ncbi:MAG TPA: SRPBCC domain-containing protein [Devosia sp.]|nr:SRPBCC domain-containing protein [Devosia sp.]
MSSADEPQTRSVVVEREIPFPPEKLWRALTQPHLIEEWLMKTDFKPVPGHKFKLSKTPKPEVNVVVDCEVLKVEPNRTLSYTWDAFGLESVVTFTLEPTPTGTRLRVEQAGFGPDQKAAYKGARASWPHFLAALEELLKRTD